MDFFIIFFRQFLYKFDNKTLKILKIFLLSSPTFKPFQNNIVLNSFHVVKKLKYLDTLKIKNISIF